MSNQRKTIAGMSKTTYYQKQKEMRAAGELAENQTLAEYLQNQNPDPQNENTISNSEISVQAEQIQIDAHDSDSDSGFKGMLKRAGENLKNTLTSDEPTPTRRGRPAGGSKTNKEDFSVLVVSLVSLLVTFAKVDERVKPNKSEIDLFSDHLSGILLRHLPINNKLSADAIDIIGIMAVSTSWYSRVHDNLVPLTITAKESPAQPVPVYKKNGRVPETVTPLQDASPEDKAFLDDIARNHREAE